MSQEPVSNQPATTELDAAGTERLRQFRSVLLQRFNDHTSGKLPLPPEQTLPLRSHISMLTQAIEPGTHEMWPALSSAERAYLAQQAADRQSNATNIGIAVLGPLAAPAIMARNLGAPPQTVQHLLEFGADMLVVEGMGRSWVTNANARVVKPELPANPAATVAVKQYGAEGNIRIKDSPSAQPEAFARQLEDWIANDLQPARPILDWHQQQHKSGEFDMAKLDQVVQRYSTPQQELLADQRAQRTGGKTIDEILVDLRKDPDGLKQAQRSGFRFATRFLKDTSTNMELDPEKTRVVIGQIEAGKYLKPEDYASLRYLREYEHREYVEKSVEDATKLGRNLGFQDGNLHGLVRLATENAENNSPYREPKAPDQDLNAPDHPGPEIGPK